MEYGIAKPSNKLLALTELDSNTWVSEVKRIRGKKQPLSSAGLHALRDEYTRSIAPARALAAETLTLERTLSGKGFDHSLVHFLLRENEPSAGRTSSLCCWQFPEGRPHFILRYGPHSSELCGCETSFHFLRLFFSC